MVGGGRRRTVRLPDMRIGKDLEELVVDLFGEGSGAEDDHADVFPDVVVFHRGVLSYIGRP